MSIRGVGRRIDVERRQWAQLDKWRKDILLSGRGEGRTTVMFGKGFSSPPTFNYSAIFNQEATDMLPYIVVPPRGSISRLPSYYGFGNDSQYAQGYVIDPGFEAQGKWRYRSASAPWQSIPSHREFLLLSTTFIVDWAAANPPVANDTWATDRWTDDGWLHDNSWLQSEHTRNRWTVTDEDHHDLGVGEEGEVCAKAVIGPNGTTNILTPVDPQSVYASSIYMPGQEWRGFVLVSDYSGFNLFSSVGGGPSRRLAPPPWPTGWDGSLHIKADADVEVQVNAVCWHNDDDAVLPPSTPSTGLVPPFNASHQGSQTPANADKVWYYEVANLEFKQSVPSGGWQKVVYDLPYDGWTSFGKTTNCLVRNGEANLSQWTLTYRVLGSPGTTVYLDNVLVNRKWRNADIPIMTIGVAEWIVDEAGVYIGADLWFKVGEPVKDYCYGRE